MIRIAVLSDIHGNVWALQAVREDLSRRSVDLVVSLGDSLYGPLEPAGTADLLHDMGALCISGNQDRILWEPPSYAPISATFQYVMEQLTPHRLNWLKGLPTLLEVVPGMLAFHGTPSSDETYLFEEVTARGTVLRSPSDMQRHVAPHHAAVMLCGHSHLPHVGWLPSGTVVVNPGSVGLPAYSDEQPYPHNMEAGSPHARYAILEEGDDSWSVSQMAIPYAWDKAAAQADRNNRPDWAWALRTGRCT